MDLWATLVLSPSIIVITLSMHVETLDSVILMEVAESLAREQSSNLQDFAILLGHSEEVQKLLNMYTLGSIHIYREASLPDSSTSPPKFYKKQF